MSGKGIREAIFNRRMICERYCNVNKNIYACFIDYEKAFDRVNHELMIKCLQDIGMNGKDIRVIVNLYWTQKAHIQLEQDLCHKHVVGGLFNWLSRIINTGRYLYSTNHLSHKRTTKWAGTCRLVTK